MKNESEVVLSIKVGEWLKEKGYDIATCTGIAIPQLIDTHVLGILRTDPDTKPKKLFGLITISKPRRKHLGNIWFGKLGKVNPKNWILDVYGKKISR